MMQQDSFSSDSYEFDDEYQPIKLDDNDQENDKFIGEKMFGNLVLSQQVKEYFKNYKKFEKSKFVQLFKFKDQIEEQKSVCAKSIDRGSTIAECYDCATDSSCIMCMDCFKNSNHEGHKVVIKKAYGGCCDCGDIQAWKKQGFCTKHTGESIEIQIDAKQEQQFLRQMRELFYLLFRQCILENINFCKDYSRKLLSNLCYLNSKGVYYNKLTYLLFSSKIPQQLIVSKNVNNRTILANILSPKIAKYLDIEHWIDLFFTMFPYYPFKKFLLTIYMKNFSIIYGDDESISKGSSISCQLLTSHQLVREYALQEGSIPMGEDIKIDKINSFDTIFFMLYHDLGYITKLQGDTPQVYFKLHTRSKEGLLKLFEYRKVIKNEQDKYEGEPDILQLARFVKYFQLEFKAMELLAKIAGILQHDKETLLIIIKTLYIEALKQQNERKMIIFKPLTRALGLFLFTYFDFDLKRLNHVNNQDQINQLIQFIGDQQFTQNINKLFMTCTETYLFHAKILSEPGLSSTLYSYIYFYKLKTKLVSSLDALNIKLLAIMLTWPQLNIHPIITPSDYVWDNSVIEEHSGNKQYLQTKVKHLQFILAELNLVTASESNELYIAYQADPHSQLYKGYVETVLLKVLNQQKTNITLPNVKEYEEWFFHRNVNLAENYLKKLSTYDKIKKAFVLNKENVIGGSKSTELINYNDFRSNLTNKSDFQSPQLTLELIKYSMHQDVYNSLWSIETISNFVAKAIQYMNLLASTESTQQNSINTFAVDKIKPLFAELMKIIYIKKKVSSKSEQLQVILELLRKVNNINDIIHPFYERLLYPQKMQEEKPQDEQKLQGQPSYPQKSELHRLKSNSEQRKRKLKEKMEQKKKSIKQRYAKQTLKFEEQQKQKLQKQQQQELAQHKLNCIICKNDDQQNLVFFVRITYKNHQKLIGLGEGVTCLSVSSCYHSVDYDCYHKLQSEVGTKRRPLIKCPFCKFASNTFLPIRASSKLVPDALKKFEASLFMEKNIDEVSILEEIVKSFYHYALLAYLDPQRTLHKRMRIYKVLFDILKHNTQLYDLQKVYEKFITNSMNLNPKVVEESYETKRSQRLLQLSLMLQNNEDQVAMDDLSQGQIDHLLLLMSQHEASEQDSNSNSGIMMKMINKLKSNLDSNDKKKEQEKPSNKMTMIFKQTMSRLFKELQLKETHMQMEEKAEYPEEKLQQNKIENHIKNNSEGFEKSQIMSEELSPNIQLCLKRLFDQKSYHYHNNIYEDLNQNNGILKLRDLPINFKPLGRINKCSCCNQITSTLSLCLICDWQGCLRDCLSPQKGKKSEDKTKDKKGGTFNHSRTHGQQSLFLILQKCNVTSITVDGLSSGLGCIYKDQWGSNFDHKQPWEKFFLDEGELDRIKITFLHEQ